ncbi:shikimate dehydrogenase [Humitalea sp. 24SJ18S-53]|uniref:shikimate dehydrogenase n=1 Tax=Humitalea sp. 24SJ18S-53 TaxID=3422307 RepID=UPI003D673B94
MADSDPLATLRRQGLLLGLIGAGIQASRSPMIHMAEAAAQGVPCVYRLIDIDRLGVAPDALEPLLQAAERMGFAGLNITYPCKQTILPLLHDLSDEARALGAVNTVVLRDGRRIGHNTDCSGFGESFRRGLAGVLMDRVVQIGTGGAGSAVAHAIVAAGAGCLTLFDLDQARAEHLAADLCARFGPGRAVAGVDLAASMAATDGLVNATPMGMAKHPGLPLPAELLRPALWVAEVVYVPLDTELVRTARARGARVLDGGGMAVFQAAHAFALFSGLTPDAERMLAGFRAALAAG